MKRILFLCLIVGTVIGQSNAQSAPRWKTLPDIPPMPHADQSGREMVNGIQLYYAIFNSRGKDPVFLLHGGFSSSDDWGFETPLLAQTHQVIVVDSRGHGRSGLGTQPLSYELMATDLKLLMDTLHIQKASIVGWSDGGITGLVMAMKHPSRVNKLFTFGSNYNRSGEKEGIFDSSLAAKFMNRVKEKYRQLSPTPEGFADLRTALGKMYSKEPDLDTAALKKIQAATFIACGEYEQFYTRAHFEALAKLVPGAQLLVLPNVSHGGPVQDPAAFHAAVIKLLDPVQ